MPREVQLETLEETDESTRQQAPVPKDAFRLVFIVFVLHGLGILLPWNLFINAKEYFEDYKLNTTLSRDADYRKNFMNYIGLGSQLPNMLMSAFNVFFQSTTVSQQTGNAGRRMMLVILLEIGVCATTVIMALVDTTESPRLFFDITIVSVVILNCCTGVYQSSSFGMAGLLPMTYSNAVVLGNNICGTIIAIVNIVSKAVSSQDLQMTAVGYFSFSIFLLLLCFSSLIVLPKLKFYRYFQLPKEASKAPAKTAAGLAAGERLLAKTSSGDDAPVASVTDGSGACCSENLQTAAECFALCCVRHNSRAVCSRYWSRYWNAFKECWIHCISVWSLFFCTLACFPAIQSAIKPVQLLSIETWFTDIFVFLFFNMFAMLGNVVSSFVQIPPPRWLALVVWIRTLVFIPFFLLCNCFPNNRAANFPVVISNDYVFIAGMVVFGLSAGYLSSLCMMYAPRAVKTAEYAGLAGMVSAFFLVLGIFCGISFGGVLFNVIQAA